jgi:hypothetical protein
VSEAKLELSLWGDDLSLFPICRAVFLFDFHPIPTFSLLLADVEVSPSKHTRSWLS